MRKLAPALLLIGLAACASPPLPEDHYYRLEIDTPAAQPTTAPARAASINVQRIAMTGVYGERPLLYSSAQAPMELRQYHYHFWADSPARMIQEQLADYLRAMHLAREVTATAGDAASEYQLSGAVHRFEQRLDGTGAHVDVVLELTLQRTDDGQRLISKNYRADIPTHDTTPLAAAQGLSRGLAQCFAAFSADLRDSKLR